MFNTIVPPSSTQYSFGACRFGLRHLRSGCSRPFNIANARATTPAAPTSLFGDGSVQFIKSSIAIKIWWSLGTKAGGEGDMDCDAGGPLSP